MRRSICRRPVLLIVAVLIAQSSRVLPAREQTAATPSAAEVRRIHQEAIAQPFDDDRFRAYLRTLGRDDQYYVVEGDLRYTEDEVRLYLASQSRRWVAADRSQKELLVNLHLGRRDIWPIGARRLSYAVDRSSFRDDATYTTVVKDMEAAARAWEKCQGCGVDFVHRPEHDGGPSHQSVTFVVRMKEMPYAGLAFFPHDPAEKRFLSLHPRYLEAGYDPVGILRHELGHVLGYRHEHASGVPGCAPEKEQNWERLTEYTPDSVMHYICGPETGSSDLELREKDHDGHQKAYEVTTGSETGLAFAPPRLRPAAEPMMRAYTLALARPSDRDARGAFAAFLPRFGSHHIIEGDLKVDDAGLAAYIAGQAQGETFGSPASGLLVNTFAGRSDIYPAGRRRLTYSLDRASLQTDLQYRRLVEDVEDAARYWQVGGITVTHVEEAEGTAARSAMHFTVRRVAADGAFVASAFFPHARGAERVLEVDQSFFNAKDRARIPVLRHQLGHILGYRHADTTRLAGCVREGGRLVPIWTRTSSNSVMRPICGVEDGEVDVLEEDGDSHRRVYGPSSAPSSAATLVVRFEGGDVSRNAAGVLKVLHGSGALPLGKHTAGRNDVVERVYAAHLQLPPSPQVADLARVLNPGRKMDTLNVGDVLVVPQVTFAKGEFFQTFDKQRDSTRLEELREKWAHLDPREIPYTGDARGSDAQRVVRVGFTRYELRLTIDDPARIPDLVRDINALDSKNIIVIPTRTGARQTRFFAGSNWHHSQRLMLKPDGEGSLVGILGLQQSHAAPPCVFGCPEVVLIDTPVHAHPDLAGAIASGSQPDTQGASARPTLLDASGVPTNRADPWDQKWHGTYMAGIIGSRLNTFGLVGINPWVSIHPWDARLLDPGPDDDPTELIDKIDRHQNEHWNLGLQIYVVANDYEVDPVTTPAARINDNPFARKVRQRVEDVLLVVAAGQPEGAEAPLDINAGTLRGPMNLGDQPNVIVVTACEDCTSGNDSRVMAGVNISTKRFVHVAAPGDRIPGPVLGGKYAESSKTSPAAAVTAGVASLMAATHRYRSPGQLKRRLMLTSRPILSNVDARGAGGLAAGILDAEAALLDPTLHYVQQTLKTRTTASGLQWKLPVFTGLDRATVANYEVKLERVVRLVREDKTIVVYEVHKEKPDGYLDDVDVIRRVGPLTISQAAMALELVTFTRPTDSGATETVTLKMSDVSDIMLSTLVLPRPR